MQDYGQEANALVQLLTLYNVPFSHSTKHNKKMTSRQTDRQHSVPTAELRGVQSAKI